jgi:hypothetical protein
MPIDYLDALEADRPATFALFRPYQAAWTDERTPRQDFHALVRLMHRVGDRAEAEHFLRSNLLVSADDGITWFLDDPGLDLYTELFGVGKRGEFAAAITAFQAQFAAPLTNGQGGGFQVGFETVPASPGLAKYLLQREPAHVAFEYLRLDVIEATLVGLKEDSEQLLFLEWRNGAWEIIGTGYHTVVRDG